MRALLSNEKPVAFVLDLPDRERIDRRRAAGFAGPQVETGVVPGTADALAVDQPFGERAVIVAAMGVDRKDLRSRTHQQHFFVTDMAKQGRVGEFGRRDTFGQIGAGGLGLLIGHIFLRGVR